MFTLSKQRRKAGRALDCGGKRQRDTALFGGVRSGGRQGAVFTVWLLSKFRCSLLHDSRPSHIKSRSGPPHISPPKDGSIFSVHLYEQALFLVGDSSRFDIDHRLRTIGP
jgi:hypothetical protein